MKKILLIITTSLLTFYGAHLFLRQNVHAANEYQFTINLAAETSNGWRGSALKVYINDIFNQDITLSSGKSGTVTFNVPWGSKVVFDWQGSDTYEHQCSFEIFIDTKNVLAIPGNYFVNFDPLNTTVYQINLPNDGSLPILRIESNEANFQVYSYLNLVGESFLIFSPRFYEYHSDLMGFYTNSDRTGDFYPLGGYFTGNGQDVTLYADWQYAENKQVHFDAGRGEGDMYSYYFYNGDTIMANTFTRSCYAFSGWSKDGGITKAYDDKANFANETGDITLTAMWEPTQCLHFHPQGGTGWVAPLPISDGANLNLPQEVFIRPNFTFTGWAETPGGNITYQPKDPFTVSGNDSQNLYAVWQYEKATEYTGTWGDPTFWEQDWYDDADNQSRYGDCISSNIELGSKDCPYLIQTAGELAYLGAVQGEMAGTWFKLDPQGGTLDLSLHEWIPINIYGSEEGTIFTDSALAHLDGAGTTITGLKVKRLVPAVRIAPFREECHDNFDADCDDGIGGFFMRAGAAGLFGETYKLWTANYQLQAPEVTITTPSMIRDSDLSLEEEERFNACTSEAAAQAERCELYGCGLTGLKDQISQLDLTLTCNATGEECTYTDGTNYANIEKSGVLESVSLNYHYTDGVYALVEASCYASGCSYQYFEPGYEDESDWSLNVECDLTGQNCTFQFADGSDDLNCHGVGFSGLDNVGTLIGTGRYTRVTDVTVQNPNLQVANLTPGYTVGGMVGLAAGWTYLMTARVEGGTLQVVEADPGNYQGTIRNKFFGGLVGLNFSSVIINGYTNSHLNYTLKEGAYSQLAKYTLPSLDPDKQRPQAAILIGGISGATDIHSEGEGILTTDLGICIMNSYSEAKITVRGDYLPHSQMVEPLADGFWTDNNFGSGSPMATSTITGGVTFRVGGIAAYINDTMVNNYYAGTIEILPRSAPEDLLDKLNAGTPLVKSTISGHSLEQMRAWDDALIANWNSMVKDWVIDDTQNDGYPIFGTLSAPPTCPADKVDVNGECVCPTGKQDIAGQCVCETDKQEVANGTCIDCDSDHIIVADECVCPTGKQEISDGTCIDCANDHVIVADQCVCPAGEQEINGQCEPMPVVFALPQPILEHQVTPENLYWNVLSLAPTMGNLTLRGYFEPDPGGPRPLNLTLKLLGQDYTTSVTTSTNKNVNFNFTIPISAFNASVNNYLFLGPHQLTVTNPDTSETDTTDWNVSFYFPIYQADHDVNWGGTFILSTNSKLNLAPQ